MTGVFQSLIGFSARRDESLCPRPHPEDDVSIPYWVFSPSRPIADKATEGQ